MKAFLIKYWETKGIQEIDGEIRQDKYFYPGFFLINRDVFFEKDKAIEFAEKKRTKKIMSLVKQLEKVEKLKFK